MKKYFLCLPFLLFLASCDAPQRTLTASNYSNGLTDNNNSGFTGGTTGSSGGTTGSNNGVTTTPGFQNCDISTKYNTVDIGAFGICQSSSDETVFKFVTSAASQTYRVCLIPTYKDASGSSTYLGNPQCTYTNANTVVTGKLYKDRSGYSSYPINGVIVMRESLTPNYYACMQGYLNWPRNACPNGATTSYCSYYLQLCPYGGGGVSGTCHNEATNYMNTICTTFKNTYSSAYADIRTKN